MLLISSAYRKAVPVLIVMFAPVTLRYMAYPSSDQIDPSDTA